MEEIIKSEIESLSKQRKSLVDRIETTDFSNANAFSAVQECRNEICTIDNRIDKLIDRLTQ